MTKPDYKLAYARLIIESLARKTRETRQVHLMREVEVITLLMRTCEDHSRYEIADACRTLGSEEAVKVFMAEAERMPAKVEPEIILAAEALARVGLGDLATDTEWRLLVKWTGFPKPFHCGHTGAYGFGPVRDATKEDPERRGAHREYQNTVRVSQHFCGGPVLWSWQGCSTCGYTINSALVVSFDETLDSKRPCLRIGWTA